MAFIALDAGDDVLAAALLYLVVELEIRDEHPGPGDHVGLAGGEDLLHVVHVEEAADGRAEDLRAAGLHRGAVVQHGILVLAGVVARGVVEVCRLGAELEDVHEALGHFRELYGVLDGGAAVLARGELDLDGEVLPAELLDAGAQLEKEAGAVLDGAAVLVGAVVGARGEEPGEQRRAVGKMQRHHVEAVGLVFFRALGLLLDDLADHLVGELLRGRAVPHEDVHAVVVVDALAELREEEVRGVHRGVGVHVVGRVRREKGHQREGYAGVIVVDLVGKLADVVLHAGVRVQGEHGEAPAVLVFRLPLAHVRPVGEGDDGRAVFRHGDDMVDDGLRGIGLRPLQEVGQGVAGDQPVFQGEVPHADGGQDVGIRHAHGHGLLSARFAKAGRGRRLVICLL